MHTSSTSTPARRPRVRLTLTLCAALAAAACGGGGGGLTTAPPVVPVPPSATQYTNPVLNSDFADPGAVRGADGAYYAYATQTTGLRVQVARSADLVTWGAPAEAMPVKPAWASESQNFWAPDVAYRDGRYVMYYSAQIDAAKRTAADQGFCVGMATSASPTGPFADVGQPVVCGPGFSTIDPQGFDDPQTGKRYLYWGSAGAPIRVQELAADRATFAPGSVAASVVPARAQPYENLVEGAWVTYRAPYYYMFYSGDNCCGVVTNVRYAVLVARAAGPTGPFEFRRDANGAAVPVLAAGSPWLGPGHNAVVRDAAGTDWMLYHAVDLNNPYLIPGNTGISRRPMLLDKITYGADGWPAVGQGGVPTTTPQTRPSP